MTVSVPAAMWTELREGLLYAAEDNDTAQQLAQLLSKAAGAVKQSDWSTQLEVVQYQACMGAGKSHVIRKLMGNMDVVLAPTNNLMNELKAKLKGVRASRVFTPHKLLTCDLVTDGTLFVDEVHTMDGLLILAAVRMLRVKRLVVVGDERQSKLRFDEGRHIYELLDFGKATLHELVYNFRNPKWIVEHNFFKLLGYDMKTHNTEDSIPVGRIKFCEYNAFKADKVMFLSKHHDVLSDRPREKSSVRANQGVECESVLVVFPNEGVSNLAVVQGFMVVAFTRHTKRLTLAYDDACPLAPFLNAFIAGTVDRKLMLETGFAIPEEEKVEPVHMRPCESLGEVPSSSVSEESCSEVQGTCGEVSECCSSWEEESFFSFPFSGDCRGQCVAEAVQAEPVRSFDPTASTRAAVQAYKLSKEEGVRMPDFRPLCSAEASSALSCCSKREAVKMLGGVFNVGVVKPAVEQGWPDRIAPGENLRLTNAGREAIEAVELSDGADFPTVLTEVAAGTVAHRLMSTFEIPSPGYAKAVSLVGPEDVLEHRHVPSSDAYISAREMCLAEDEQEGCSHNTYGSLEVPSCRTARASEGLYSAIAKGKVSAETDKFFQYGNPSGHHFNDRPSTRLKCLVARYDNHRHWAIKDEHRGAAEAKLVVDSWMRNFRVGQEQVFLDEAEMMVITTSFMKDAVVKGWVPRADDEYARSVAHFTIKTMFKPSGKPVAHLDLYKPPQGISAFEPSNNLVFGLGFRMIQALINKHEQCTVPGVSVVTDFGQPMHDYIAQMQLSVDQVPLGAEWAITDGEMFDSNQEAYFTQAIEKDLFRRYGAAEDFLSLFYSIRKDWKVKSAGGIKASPDGQNASGHSATILGNSTVSKVLSNYVLNVSGPRVVTYKGDDYACFGTGMSVNKERLLEIEDYMPLRLKVSIGSGGEFCGLVANGRTFSVNVWRRVRKLMGARFADYDHFCEVKPAVTEFLKLMSVLESNGMMIKQANIDVNGITPGQYDAALDFLVSFTKLSEQQFLSAFRVHYEGTSFLDSNFMVFEMLDPLMLRRLRRDEDFGAKAKSRGLRRTETIIRGNVLDGVVVEKVNKM